MPLRSLSDNATSTLISIDAKHGVYAAQAKDLLQAANAQVIYKQSTNVKAGKITLDISTFAKGIYHLQVLGIEDKNLVTTFIKQ